MLVTLIAHTNDPEKTIAAAAKLCYSDAHIETLLDGLTPEKTAAFLQKLNDFGHASPIEHASLPLALRAFPAPFWHRSPATALQVSVCRASAMCGWKISVM